MYSLRAERQCCSIGGSVDAWPTQCDTGDRQTPGESVVLIRPNYMTELLSIQADNNELHMFSDYLLPELSYITIAAVDMFSIF